MSVLRFGSRKRLQLDNLSLFFLFPPKRTPLDPDVSWLYITQPKCIQTLHFEGQDQALLILIPSRPCQKVLHQGVSYVSTIQCQVTIFLPQVAPSHPFSSFPCSVPSHPFSPSGCAVLPSPLTLNFPRLCRSPQCPCQLQ